MKKNIFILAGLILFLATGPGCDTGSEKESPVKLDQTRLDMLELLVEKGGYEGAAARIALASATGDTTSLDSANSRVRTVDLDKLTETETPSGHYWNWHYDIALYYMFRDCPEILYPETRAALEERFWRIINLPNEGSAVCRAITGNDPENVRVTMYTENHTLIRASMNLLVAQLFEGRTYDDGRAGQDHLRFWERWLSNYLDYRAGHMFWEVNSSTYENVILVSLLDLHAFASSALVRKKAGMLVDLILASGAIESLDGVRGGGKARQYRAFKGQSRWTATSCLFLDTGEPPARPQAWTFNKVISTYRPPQLVKRIAAERERLGTFVLKSRRPHSIDPGAGYRCRKYSYITPEFILGGFQVFGYGRFVTFPENKWAGLIMRGHPDARIMPYFHPCTGRDYSYHEYYQHENVLVAWLPEPSRIYVATDALEEVSEREGWIFARMGRSYAAARPASGSYRWEDGPEGAPGRMAVLESAGVPIIIEADTCTAGFEAFRNRILARSLRFDGRTLEYENRRGQIIECSYGKTPSLDGKNVRKEVESYPLFDSPYLKSAWGSGVIRLDLEGQGLVLDFSDPSHPRRIEWQGLENRPAEPVEAAGTAIPEQEEPAAPELKEPAEVLFRADFEDGRAEGWGNAKVIQGGYGKSRFAITPLEPYDRRPVEIFFKDEKHIPLAPETRIRFAVRTSRTGVVALFGWSLSTFDNFQTDYFYFPGGEWRIIDLRVRDYFPEQAGERLANINLQVVPYCSGEVRIDDVMVYNP